MQRFRLLLLFYNFSISSEKQFPGMKTLFLLTSVTTSGCVVVTPSIMSHHDINKNATQTSIETPKRLHVSNIPFRFRDPDLRAMFGVSQISFFCFKLLRRVFAASFLLRSRQSMLFFELRIQSHQIPSPL